MPSSTARAGSVDRHGPALEQDLARVGRRQAEEDAGQLGPPRPDQAGQAEDLAGADVEADVRHARRPAMQAANLQHRLAPFDGHLGEDGAQLAADHHADQLGPGDLGHRPRADEARRRAGPSRGRRSGAAPPAGARCR